MAVYYCVCLLYEKYNFLSLKHWDTNKFVMCELTLFLIVTFV